MAHARVMAAGLFAAVAVLALAAPAAATNDPMKLRLLPDAVAQSTGALCLDGSAPGYYFRPGYGDGADKWIVWFEGGGWCYTREDCLARSKTFLGSNKFWAPTFAPEGMLSADEANNPDFYNWNSVKFMYCDGDSFSGNKAEADNVDGTDIYYRGHRIKVALLDDLVANEGMDKAKEVLVSGCSAGGLSTYLHADFVAAYAMKTSGATTKAVAGSGFFMDLPNAQGHPIYETEMRNVFTFQNATGGMNAACLASYPAADQWHCNMAQYVYPHVKTPFFIFNSYYDEWQMGNILFVDIPNMVNCEFYGYKNCTSQEMTSVVNYGYKMQAAMRKAPQFLKAGNGAFLHSCWNHCAASSDNNWVGTSIGGLSMRDAVHDWYFETKGSVAYNTIGCAVDPATRAKCNPTCHVGYRP